MKKYLLSKMQKIAVGIVTLSYIAYALFETESYQLSPEQFFQPYSRILFVLCITLTLILIKRKNWKSKVNILLLIATLVFIFFITTSGFESLRNFLKGSAGLAPDLLYVAIYYKIGKIVLLDLFAIFAFFAIHKTVNELEETKE